MPEALLGQAAGAEIFAVVGAGPLLGRPVLAEEDREGPGRAGHPLDPVAALRSE